MSMSMPERATRDPDSLRAALMAGKKVAPDVIDLLMEDHRTVMGWFDWYQGESRPDLKRRVLINILKALAAHMTAEEEIFYPEAQRCTGVPALVDRAVKEHKRAGAIMRDLARATGGPPDSLVETLSGEIAMHISEEETQLFPAVRHSSMELYQIGALVAARRVELLLEYAEEGR